ncbi:ribokinase [Serpentinicella alkaliphila]|uniref:Ribokinase n=1 Tax=Serpentinicella alkaliphila TaxID=1734049 RepID=A0A4R2T1P0_9FIRM|nr:ribokinase [Serpentinicella alkaliphila]QUH25839.1 ribokinase [Serpentinicella alkaliphila]TCP96060.1 ribokinase [Serpentinicella alkaliphila]
MIVVVGSLNMDLVTYTNRMPVIGETIIGKSFKQIPGGKGANQADAIAKLGSTVRMIGCVGEDVMGETLLESLYKDGVDISMVKRVKGVATGIASITVDSSANNSIIVVPGANNMLSIEDIKEYEQAIQDSDIVVAQLEVPIETVKYVIKSAKLKGKITILNPAPAAELDDDLLSYVDILIPNKTELELLSGLQVSDDNDLYHATQVLLNKGVRDLIVTLGSKGCVHINNSGTRVYPAYKVQAIDTTAAGDSFIGAIAVGLSEGMSYEQVIPFATAVGALTVTKEGAQSSMPLRSEVEAFTRKNVF